MAQAGFGTTENKIIKQQAAREDEWQAVQEDEWYDLLPIEKKLISYTLGLGVFLLVIFLFVFGVK
ncbi:hypothetical protein ACOBQJ_15050 [Pelotomaculum propionicicum]|uniref:hypothetical protein n=1 Tax=Pelotomaculum propionicicum TaxID=258475 RepID=UPI003B828DC3